MEDTRVKQLKYSVDIIGGIGNVKIFAYEQVLIDVDDLPDHVFNEPLEYDLKPKDVVDNINIMIKYYIRKFKSG